MEVCLYLGLSYSGEDGCLCSVRRRLYAYHALWWFFGGLKVITESWIFIYLCLYLLHTCYMLYIYCVKNIYCIMLFIILKIYTTLYIFLTLLHYYITMSRYYIIFFQINENRLSLYYINFYECHIFQQAQ